MIVKMCCAAEKYKNNKIDITTKRQKKILNSIIQNSRELKCEEWRKQLPDMVERVLKDNLVEKKSLQDRMVDEMRKKRTNLHWMGY